MRSPADADIQVIDITNRCFLKCSGCTRDIAHQFETREMDPDTFRAALNSLKGWWQPGKVIGIIGGEPTISRHFKEICRIFREEFNPGELSIGREPIGDFNAMAMERLFDRTNGKGLWTSFGPKWRDVAEDVFLTFSHWNPNDHSQGGTHQVSLVDAREMCELLGIRYDDFPLYRANCWLQNQWSGCISTSGKAYFCERAGSLDMLYNGGKRGWDVRTEPDWWKRTPDQFGEQLEICEMCSMCLPGPNRVDATDRDIVGTKHLERLQAIGSPAVKHGNYDLIHELPVIDQRVITTKDNYVGDSGIRVAADNQHVRPKKLSCVVVAVGNIPHVVHTVTENLQHVDQLVVVTDRPGIFPSNGVPPKLRIVHAQTPPADDAFNKGYYLNAGLAALDKPEWVLFTDADILLSDNLREFFFSHSWNPGCLYYTSRQEQASPGDINKEPNGYFQLWNPKAVAIGGLPTTPNKLPSISEAFCSAGGVDSWFAAQYPDDKRIFVPELGVTHLDHGEFSRRWNGGRTDVCWRQIGVIARRPDLGQAIAFVSCGDPLPFEVREGVVQIRLVDTKYALLHETEMVKTDVRIDEIIQAVPTGLKFLGRDIGWNHIHVSARF